MFVTVKWQAVFAMVQNTWTSTLRQGCMDEQVTNLHTIIQIIACLIILMFH